MNLKEKSMTNNPYSIKISTMTDMIDQKRGLVELKPGYHVIIRVVPKIIETSEDFEKFDVTTRGCKLPYESEGLNFVQNYSKVGCEMECALNQSLAICKCLPWYYPNDFSGTPMCDMFGAKCFDMIMSDETHYKNCSAHCLEDCKGTSYLEFHSYDPINFKETCQQPLFVDLFQRLYKPYEPIDWYENITLGKPLVKFSIEKYCEDYLQKYISIVTVETPTSSIIKSKRVTAVSFIEQLAIVGGIFGLFSGVSILSIVEIVCLCLTVAKISCSCRQKNTETKVDVENNLKQDVKDEEIPTYVKDFVSVTIVATHPCSVINQHK